MTLPLDAYQQFQNLLSIVTRNQATCDESAGSHCFLENPCDQYPKLWNFTFSVNITDVGYLVFPISSLASDFEGICRIFVTYEEFGLSDKPMVPTIGTMVFQSVVYEQNQNTVTLTPNMNTKDTLFEPYINTTWGFTEGPSAFLPTRVFAEVDPMNHMVVLEQSILDQPNSKFLLDTNCSFPYFW